VQLHGATLVQLYGEEGVRRVQALFQAQALERAKPQPKASVAAPSSVGQRIFKLANEGNVDALKPLLDEWRGNPIIHWTNSRGGETPLLTACYRGHTAVVELLLSLPNIGDGVNKPDDYDRTPLYWACGEGHTAVVELLLSLPNIGDSVNKPDKGGYTPLHSACFKGHTAAVELLLSLPNIGDSVNKPNYAGRTPLYYACYKGDTAVVELLLSLPNIGDSVNMADNHGNIPLQVAKNKEIKTLLRAHGATR
jgi:ankyrin repeat protein